jgi:tetratricopeptide (TPR) repeat protein
MDSALRTKFPFTDKAYTRAGGALREAWPRLHEGDREVFPDAAGLKRLVAAHKALAPDCGMDKAAAQLQEAWRAYHAGAFGEAIERGLAVGLLGSNVANKASNIYATYLEGDEARKLALFQQAAARAEALQEAAPSLPNAWYFHAQALGRYSQGISVAKALAEGLAARVRASLERALALDEKHAEAHIAFGSYHAEIVAKVGAILAGLTYGAKREAALSHFETALKLLPHSAIARIEYANGLAMLFGRARLADARRLYAEAAKCEPQDAMERLDVEQARAELVA